MIPGRRHRAYLELSISGIAESARRETELHSFTPRLARLWSALCDQAENTVYQLIIRNDDGRLDWGLKKHRSKVDYAQLVAIYWWILLYQLVLFRNRGLYGYFPVGGQPALRRVTLVAGADPAESPTGRVN